MCMVRGGCLAWKRMDQDCNVKVERKELSGGVRSVLAVPSDSLLQQDFSAAATARQVTGSPSPSCPLYGWRSRPHPEAHYPAARASSTSLWMEVPTPSQSPLSRSESIFYIFMDGGPHPIPKPIIPQREHLLLLI